MAKRSCRQNRYYHGAIVPAVADHFVISKAKAHELLLGLHGQDKRTSEMTITEQESYHSRIRIWASAELNIWIDTPK